MTDRQKKIDTITDKMYYHFTELVSLANDLEDINLQKYGEAIRSIADQLERTAIRIMDRHLPKVR